MTDSKPKSARGGAAVVALGGWTGGDGLAALLQSLGGGASLAFVLATGVAPALEGLRVKSFNGDVEVRKTDHQLQQPLFISVWQKTDAKNTYSVENTGYTFAPVKAYDSYVSSTPTSCQMKRP